MQDTRFCMEVTILLSQYARNIPLINLYGVWIRWWPENNLVVSRDHLMILSCCSWSAKIKKDHFLLWEGMSTCILQCLWRHIRAYFASPGLLMTLYCNAISFYGDTIVKSGIKKDFCLLVALNCFYLVSYSTHSEIS